MDRDERRRVASAMRTEIAKIQQGLAYAHIEVAHDLQDGIDWAMVKKFVAECQVCLERVAQVVETASMRDHQ